MRQFLSWEHVLVSATRFRVVPAVLAGETMVARAGR